ncbi:MULTISPECIES: 16S rRNA (cytosine(1402)-N(4))-methyltransferase RsmH [Mycolicibacterium]|uniref:16S rRNA (cytosine(1402)-N(4))-methyltransferase RsmH n=1 Tax=Mycolicibacterium TaxID=1866885 RepID=UPI0013D13A7D|nr:MULTISPECIES: 16S rRNA (cytosine(1402)-N(4))-methyltransferase RsmH [Mycolicibacterium]MCV7184506.1 16S rRNA (cytosine(1402)-N(4))-methyltransferase RsmH [Mycolicibacterium murale]
MKHSATSSDQEALPEFEPARVRATWPLSEPTLAYFPDARFSLSGRDLGAGAVGPLRRKTISATTGSGVAVADDPQPRGAEYGHIPVLLDRCTELLAPALTARAADGTGALFIDATLGAGGHTERLLSDLPGLHALGLDRDPSALQIAGARLAPFGNRVTLIRTRYDGIADALEEAGHPAENSVDGVLFDLGVSSMQLDRTERGFSYSADAPLDMRMDPDLPLTAADILNTYDHGPLAAILREYGEEKFASKIAKEVIRRRERTPFATTGDLVELLYAAIPAPARRTGGHPAKRTFQALRVAVNAELDSLRAALPAALAALRPGGRVVVMAYQSLEDRIVKSVFAAATASRTPPGLPVELPGHEPEFVSLTRGAERADQREIDRNPRSAAVRLRAVQRPTDRGGS